MRAAKPGNTARVRRLLSPGIGALLVAVGIWGGTFVVTKSARDGIGAFTLLWFRFAVAWLCLAPFAYGRRFRLRLVFAPAYVLFGLTGMVFHLGLETLGINYTSVSSAAMIAGAIPHP